MNLQIKKAFTLVELIVVITILAILWTIAFVSMSWYSKTARDSTRTSDISKIKSSLELFHINSNKYPDPTEAQPITYSGWLAWYQWIFWNSTFINVEKLDKIPKDPLTEKEYAYSVLNTKQEYEIAWIMEWDDVALNQELITKSNALEKTAKAMLSWTYNGISLRVNANNTSYVLAIPSIITSIDINNADVPTAENNRKLETIIAGKELVLENYKNLPHNYLNSNYISNKETTNIDFQLLNNNDITKILIYEWDISNLTSEILVTKLQESYTWTTISKITPTNELFNIDVTDSSQLEKLDNYWVNFINNNLWWWAQSKIYATCNGIAHNTTKSYYTNNTTPFPTLCTSVKQDFVCIDWIWKNTSNLTETLNTTTYPFDTCTESWALNCDANSTYTININHIYNVPQLDHSVTQNVTADMLESNGTFRYTTDVTCNNWVLENTVETWPEYVSCDTGYIWNWSICKLPTSCEDVLTNSVVSPYWTDVYNITTWITWITKLSCNNWRTLVSSQDISAVWWWLFTNLNEAKYYRENDPNHARYSILNQLENFKNTTNSTFTFKLEWPNINKYNEWSQTTNPLSDIDVAWYNPIHIDWSNMWFVWLELWNWTHWPVNWNSLLDWSANHSAWWFAIWQYMTFNDWAIPSDYWMDISPYKSKSYNLWVKKTTPIYEKSCNDLLINHNVYDSTGYWAWLAFPQWIAWIYRIDPLNNWTWFDVECNMVTDWWGRTLVFYSNSNNVPRSSIDNEDWNIWPNVNFSRLWSMRNIKNPSWLYEFFIKDSSDIWRYFTFTQTNAYYQNPVWNSYTKKTWNFYYSSRTTWSTRYWLALWNFWNTSMQNNCSLSNAYEWSSWTYCLQDQYSTWYNTWPWFYDTNYDIWAQQWVKIYQK